MDFGVVIPITSERHAVRSLIDAGLAKWSGGKPKGKTGLKVKGKPLAETLLEERR